MNFREKCEEGLECQIRLQEANFSRSLFSSQNWNSTCLNLNDLGGCSMGRDETFFVQKSDLKIVSLCVKANIQNFPWYFLFLIGFSVGFKAESFYNIHYGSSMITSKSSSKISVIKTNTCDDLTKIVHFGILILVLSWRQQNHKCLFWLLRFFDELFDVIIDNPLLTV